MPPEPQHNHYVRRVVLPSGKTIEVVYFDDLQPEPAPAAPLRELHLCEACDGDLVYPTEWGEAGSTHWEVSLRCHNCEWTGSGVYEQGLVERFDDELDRGTEALVRDLRRLAHANMEDEVERFVRALQADCILPDDF